MRKIDWIAVFKKDLTCKVFQEPGKSEDVLYWIRRTENGKFHTATSTGNRYPLRDFSIYDTEMKPTLLAYENDGVDSKWECISLTEDSLDYWGSHCSAIIRDTKGEKLELRVHGRYSSTFRQPNASIADYLYPRAIFYFLSYLSKYRDWKSVEQENPSLFDDITNHNGIPQAIFELVDQNYKDFNASNTNLSL